MSAEIPIAIIGLGGTFPGGSNTPALFYEFLRNKVGFKLQVQQVFLTDLHDSSGRWYDRTAS
jgi:hypothetical protein